MWEDTRGKGGDVDERRVQDPEAAFGSNKPSALARIIGESVMSDDHAIRIPAATEMVSFSGEEEADMLLAIMKEGRHADVRAMIARSSHLLSVGLAEQIMTRGLRDNDDEVVCATLMAVRNIEYTDAIRLLVEQHLSRGVHKVRELACIALLWRGIGVESALWKDVWEGSSQRRLLTAGFERLSSDETAWWSGLVNDPDSDIKTCAIEEVTRRGIAVAQAASREAADGGFVASWRRARSTQRELALWRSGGWIEASLDSIVTAARDREMLILGEMHSQACDSSQTALAKVLIDARIGEWWLGYEPDMTGKRTRIRETLHELGFSVSCLETSYASNNKRGLWWRDREIAAVLNDDGACVGDRGLVIYGQAHMLGEGCFVSRLGRPAIRVFGVPCAPMNLLTFRDIGAQLRIKGRVWRSKRDPWVFVYATCDNSDVDPRVAVLRMEWQRRSEDR